MVVDLDGFKEVNDIRGHDAGDQVLQSLARRLESVVRASDTVARVGGDEFVVLSIGTRTEEEAAALVGRLRQSLRQPYQINGGVVEIDASIGWALFPSDGATPAELLGRADVQMFATKRDAGDRRQRRDAERSTQESSASSSSRSSGARSSSTTSRSSISGAAPSAGSRRSCAETIPTGACCRRSSSSPTSSAPR